jgi:hypothetical protein
VLKLSPLKKSWEQNMPTNSHIPDSYLVNSILFYKHLSILIQHVLSVCDCAKVIKRNVILKWSAVKPHRHFAVHVVRISMVDCQWASPDANITEISQNPWRLAFLLQQPRFCDKAWPLTATVNTAVITSKMLARFTESSRYDTPQTRQWTASSDTNWNLTNCVRTHSCYPSNEVHGAESILRRIQSVSSSRSPSLSEH